MTRKELSQIYYINQEIKMWEKELERVREESEIKGQEITDMPRGGGIADKTGERAARKIDIEMVIIGKLKEIQIQRGNIMKFINSVESSYIRQIIYYRHILLMKWEDIAGAMGGECNERSLKKMHSRWLKKMEEENDQ